MSTIQLAFPGIGPEVLAAAKDADLFRTVKAKVAAYDAARHQALKDAVATARSAYLDVDARITYAPGKSAGQLAEDEVNRAERHRLRQLISGAESDLAAYGVFRKKWPRTVWTAPQTPAQARRASRTAPHAPQPSRKAYDAGSWVRWEDPFTGAVRFGVVTSAGWTEVRGETTPAGSSRHTRYVVPADGGDAVAMVPAFARNVSDGVWVLYGRGPSYPQMDTRTVRITPALGQEGLFE